MKKSYRVLQGSTPCARSKPMLLLTNKRISIALRLHKFQVNFRKLLLGVIFVVLKAQYRPSYLYVRAVLGFKTDNSLANFENLRRVCTNQSDCFASLFQKRPPAAQAIRIKLTFRIKLTSKAAQAAQIQLTIYKFEQTRNGRM